jgi:hypothetical protein
MRIVALPRCAHAGAIGWSEPEHAFKLGRIHLAVAGLVLGVAEPSTLHRPVDGRLVLPCQSRGFSELDCSHASPLLHAMRNASLRKTCFPMLGMGECRALASR